MRSFTVVTLYLTTPAAGETLLWSDVVQYRCCVDEIIWDWDYYVVCSSGGKDGKQGVTFCPKKNKKGQFYTSRAGPPRRIIFPGAVPSRIMRKKNAR